MTTTSSFHLVDVESHIGDKRLLAPTTLQLRPGRICGIIGRNGAGKSSLLRLLARHSAPSRGSIALNGQDIAGISERDYARMVAHMPQGTPPVETLVLRDLVALGRYPWHGAFGRMRDEDHAAVARALERTGLTPLAARMAGTLSGGELQRARLAMMLAQGADWLILDEPCAALDLAWALEVLGHLRSLSDDGKGVLIALHDMNLAARFCDDLLAIKSGQVIGHGPVSDVFRADLLSELFDLRITLAAVAGTLVAVPEPAG